MRAWRKVKTLSESEEERNYDEEEDYKHHWPLDLLAEQYLDFAFTEDELEDQSNETLATLLSICEADDIQAEDCIPCRAFMILKERDDTLAGQGGDFVDEDAIAEARPQRQSAPPQDILELVDELRSRVILDFYDPVGQTARRSGFTEEDLALMVVVARTYVDQNMALANTGWTMPGEKRQLLEQTRQFLERIGK